MTNSRTWKKENANSKTEGIESKESDPISTQTQIPTGTFTGEIKITFQRPKMKPIGLRKLLRFNNPKTRE
jgi:hypothetical protein